MTPLPRSKYTNCRTWNGKSHKDRIPECRKGGVKYHKAKKSSDHFQRKYHKKRPDCQTRGKRWPKDNIFPPSQQHHHCLKGDNKCHKHAHSRDNCQGNRCQRNNGKWHKDNFKKKHQGRYSEGCQTKNHQFQDATYNLHPI
uniref:Uncharacterized protein n=1 Tax=Cacopsylla melanoneura TaxID=428564 RepID=A0A8D9E3Z1_9HEMI